MQIALKVINTYKKGRLKSFKNYSDAVAYAKTGYKQCSCNHSTTTAMIQEQSNNFRAPKTQEFIAFKRLIEDGDLEAVKNIVWENPRYLISSADTPAILQIICSRKCQENETLKHEIRMLLEDQFYVPVLRAEGNACPAIIGEPFSPTSPLNLNRDPISPRIEVRAFAGPMTKTQAVEFRKKWKTPPRITPKKGQSDVFNIMNSPGITLRLQDTEKGLEYVGRDLAKEYQVPWKEYWSFLKDFVDFRTDEGLTKLEKYLEQRFKDKQEQLFYSMRNLITNANISTYDEDKSTNCQQISKEINASNDIQYLCDKFVCMRSLTAELDNIDGDTDSSEFFTPPSSPELIRDNFDDDMQNAEEGPPMFIEESFPTKLDYAVYNALSSVICSETYPYIYRWRHDMRLAMNRDPYRYCYTVSSVHLFFELYFISC
ncbi:ankyrin repeat and LEM domain-containing protein 2 isoform X3 [Pogonomyrmex barbatus]|uniref:Ankyrin repeat and LEM domain-containing protein 2 isoform X3 n=1 Tax=Pogonomyrmex barbatus TaxID=144034 RepID=A0A6I9WKY4_9HYME|nr:ankyrin repeat and LEM domain-containing protein 2 isoform X3 [Pogonomyrmex barbatus]